MRRLGQIFFVIIGLGEILFSLQLLSMLVVFPLVSFTDITLSQIKLVLFLQKNNLALLAGTLLIAFARPLSGKLFLDEDANPSVSAEQLLRVLLIAVGIFFGFTQVMTIAGAIPLLFDETVRAISLESFLYSLPVSGVGLAISAVLIFRSSTITKWVFPISDNAVTCVTDELEDGQQGSEA